MRPLPVLAPSELALFGDGLAPGATNGVPDGNVRLFSYSFLHDFRQQSTSYSGIAAVNSGQVVTKASIAGSAYQTLHIDVVSGSYFSVLGVPALLGRTIFESDDNVAGASPVAVASFTVFDRRRV
jgi:hypothetical protein